MHEFAPLFTVITKADDLSLLSVEELRAAVGLSDNSRDDDLARIGARAADAITQACKVAADGAVPPTLRQENVSDTLRPRRRARQGGHERLFLSRRPIVSVDSVVEAGVTLDPSDYEIRAAEGSLLRLSGDAPACWSRDKIVVTYDAGWDDVPEGLKRAAEKLVRLYWFEGKRDPNERQVSIPGVIEVQRWVGAASDPGIPQGVMDDLGPYINPLA